MKKRERNRERENFHYNLPSQPLGSGCRFARVSRVHQPPYTVGTRVLVHLLILLCFMILVVVKIVQTSSNSRSVLKIPSNPLHVTTEKATSI
jgi:hypothetical protein